MAAVPMSIRIDIYRLYSVLCAKDICLIVLYNCMKFHLNSFNGCQVTERTRNSIAND